MTKLEEPEAAVVQEVNEVDKLEEELQECLDHRPSSFEKGKPRSILCLPLISANVSNYIMIIILLH